MKQFWWRNALSLGVALVAVVAGAAVTINAGGAPKTVRIIYTNDLMGYAEPCG